jgi:hypothetical protein
MIDAAAAQPRLIDLRCELCSRKLADYANRIEMGSLVIREWCRRCKHMNVVTVTPKTS